jgi:hypothetical protein
MGGTATAPDTDARFAGYISAGLDISERKEADLPL